MKELTGEYADLGYVHGECQPEGPGHECGCLFSPPCNACAECPAWIEEAWQEVPRWKIACINWTSKDAPQFVAYIATGGGAEFQRYCYTNAEA